MVEYALSHNAGMSYGGYYQIGKGKVLVGLLLCHLFLLLGGKPATLKSKSDFMSIFAGQKIMMLSAQYSIS